MYDINPKKSSILKKSFIKFNLYNYTLDFSIVHKRKCECFSVVINNISKLLHELNYHFGYINKPNDNEKTKHSNLITLHSLINKYITETKQPVDESFFDYKSNLNSIKHEINILSSELKN